MRRAATYASIALLIGLAVAPFFAAAAQSALILHGKIVTEGGKPVTNQPIMIEGKKDATGGTFKEWFHTWTKTRPASDYEKVMAVTDWKGNFQIINLPAGNYTIKLVRPGSEPLPVKKFTLFEGYTMTAVEGAVTVEQLGREGS